jgi:hypothetical protein
MKSLKLIAFSFYIVSILISCKKEDQTSSKSKVEIEKNLIIGTWKITKFTDSGNDETNDFSSYIFTFNNSGTLTANNVTNNYIGTWSIEETSNSDDNNDDIDLYINFNLSNNFKDLNDNWNVFSQTESKIELIDISNGDGGSEYLTFQKVN